MLIGILHPLIVFVLVLVLLRVGIRIADKPKTLNEVLALLVSLELLESDSLCLGDDWANLSGPFLEGSIRLRLNFARFLDGRLRLLLLSVAIHCQDRQQEKNGRQAWNETIT